MATVDFTFPHEWSAEILPERPYKLPRRWFFYPRYAEEVERGALEVMVQPAQSAEPFLGTFALGFWRWCLLQQAAATRLSGPCPGARHADMAYQANWRGKPARGLP